MVFVQTVGDQEGNWREHYQLLKNFDQTLHLFYMPEIHTALVPILENYATQGNFHLRDMAAKCLAKIFQFQHHMPAREELMEFVIKKLAKGKSFSHRRTYISFCKYVVSLIPFEMFKELFSEILFAMHKDPIPKVRQHLSEVLIVIKPYYDRSE